MRIRSQQSFGKKAIVYLLTPALCAVMLMTTAFAQEAPRDSGSLIKPPTIKPPTANSQSTSSGRSSSSRRRRRARRTRARMSARRAVATRVAATPRQIKGVVVESADNMPSSTTTASSTSRPKAPISGGVLNGRALILPPPVYPATAKAANVEGTVVVRVLIDENGKITETEAVSGPSLLRKAAEDAAREARFAPTQLSGMPVRVTGVITYNFVVPQ